jgi:hypothetical protein
LPAVSRHKEDSSAGGDSRLKPEAGKVLVDGIWQGQQRAGNEPWVVCRLQVNRVWKDQQVLLDQAEVIYGLGVG